MGDEQAKDESHRANQSTAQQHCHLPPQQAQALAALLHLLYRGLQCRLLLCVGLLLPPVCLASLQAGNSRGR